MSGCSSGDQHRRRPWSWSTMVPLPLIDLALAFGGLAGGRRVSSRQIFDYFAPSPLRETRHIQIQIQIILRAKEFI